MKMGVDIKLNPSYYKKVGLKGKGFENAIEQSIDHGLHDADVTARREAPVDTGNLRGDITKHRPDRFRGELRTHALYWRYIQYGTAPHKIRPKKARHLVFENKKGETIYAKEVNHPGTTANPFITRTRNKVLPKFKEYFIDALKSEGIID